MRLIVAILLIFSALLTACAGESAVNEEAPPAETSPTEETVAENTDDTTEQIVAAAALPTATATVPPTATPFPTATVVPPLGDLRQETDIVEFGIDETTLSRISDIVSFYNGNIFRARDGGEGLLNFKTGLVLRLFNDSEVSALGIGEGSAHERSMALIEGGFAANYKPDNPNEKLEVTVPSGAQITILGTRFFVVYDPEKERATVANFDGEVQIEVDGIPTDLQPGFYTRIPDGEQPDPQLPIPDSADPFTDFEEAARELLSPIAAADQYPEGEVEEVAVAPSPTPIPTTQAPPAPTATPVSSNSGPSDPFSDLQYHNISFNFNQISADNPAESLTINGQGTLGVSQFLLMVLSSTGTFEGQTACEKEFEPGEALVTYSGDIKFDVRSGGIPDQTVFNISKIKLKPTLKNATNNQVCPLALDGFEELMEESLNQPLELNNFLTRGTTTFTGDDPQFATQQLTITIQ